MRPLAAPPRRPHYIPPEKPARRKGPPRIARWLFVSAAAVFLMAVIGAITRLTESGLSIVEWKPVTGALPPLSEADWNHEFQLYRQSPQFIKVNHGMTLDEFRHIFFWEWLHRLWGRTVGLVYFIPLCFYWMKGRIPERAKPSFLFILALGVGQGFLGWFMVKSGLVDRPAVSHYRLAAHLMLAFFIYACLFRLGLAFAIEPDRGAGKMSPLRGYLKLVIALAAVTMTWGAFVAGLRAGLFYNTFPTMDGHWIPPELDQYRPQWQAFFADPATVQFTHRVLAASTFCAVMVLVQRGLAFNPPRRLKRVFTALGLMAAVQVALGISTLLSHVNIMLAVAHQAGALTLLTLLVWLLHEIPYIPKEK